MNKLVSDATKRNWNKLNADSSTKLTKRANKRLSKKKILPIEYLSNSDNTIFIRNVISLFENNNWNMENMIYSFGISLLEKHNLLEKENVKKILKEMKYKKIKEIMNLEIPTDECDLLGLIYQAIQLEGEKNKKGSYYTSRKVTDNMTNDFDFAHKELFLDPCCGSGAFLLSLNNVKPEQIFGCDRDKIAVMIAKINLLLNSFWRIFFLFFCKGIFTIKRTWLYSFFIARSYFKCEKS